MTEWQPIKTAPHGEAGKPETYVMLSKQEQGTTLVCTGYVNKHGAFEWFGGGMMGLTHWMPLPEPLTPPARLGTSFPGNETFDDEPGRA